MPLLIRNPHSILAALTHRPEAVLEVEFPREKNFNDTWKQIEELFSNARSSGPRSEPSKKGGSKQRNKMPQNMVTERGAAAYAVIHEKSPLAMEELFRLKGTSNKHQVWLGLDCLQDPQNVGALFRTAAFLGVTGVLITTERSAPLTSVVYDIAAGAVEQLPFAMVTNLVHALKVAKEQEIWVLGTSEHAKDRLQDQKLDRDWLVMMGNEEKGLRRLTQENCDLVVGISPASKNPGDVTSLNVSVATGMVLYQLLGRF